MVESLRSDIEKECGSDYKFDEFTPIKQTTQVVAGLNFFIKIKTGEKKYIHVKIYRRFDQTKKVTHVETGKSESDPL